MQNWIRSAVCLALLGAATLAPAQEDADSIRFQAESLEKAGRLDEAEAAYRKLAKLFPRDRLACGALAGYLNKPLWRSKSRFDEAIPMLEHCAATDPNDAAGHLALGTLYWEKAFRDQALDNRQKDGYADKAIQSLDRALALKPDFFEAIDYKNLSYRVKALATDNPALRTRHLETANALQKRSTELREQRELQNKYGGDPVLKAFVERLEASVAGGDRAAFDKVIDVDARLDAAMRGIDGPPALAAQFRQVTKGIASFGGPVVDAVKQGARFSFQRIRSGAGGRPEALFRQLGTDGGVNYYELALRRDAAGAVRVIDLYLYAKGEWESEALRRNWMSDLASAGLLAQLKRVAGVETDLAYGPQAELVGKLAMAGDSAGALREFQKLPPSQQATKNLLTIRVFAAQKVGEREYTEAIEAYARHLPNDPALHFMQLDYLVTRKQYDRALASLDYLDRAIGGDAYLDVIRGNLLFMKGDAAGAKAAMQRANEREPSLAAPYEGLLQLSLSERDFKQTAILLYDYERKAQVAINDLTQVPAYADFVRSDSYKIWKSDRDSRMGTGGGAGVVGGVVGGVPAAPQPGVVPPPPPPPPASAVRVGGQIKPPAKLNDVPPVYPDIAKQARVQGVVILECTISPQGTVSDVRVVRGIPLLDQAAIDAVKQYRFAPTLLNGVPVPVIMTVTVNFKLS